METINPEFIDMYRGDTQKFDVSPGTLANGFDGGTDVVKFTAKRTWSGANEIALFSPANGVAIIDPNIARVTIPPTATSSFPLEKVEMKFGVEVIRGSEKFSLLSGVMIVKPVVRQ